MEPRVCYFVMETQVNDKGEYNALIAVEGEQGYHKTDWYWGKDFALAEQCADEKNAEGGMSKDDAWKIVVSTMRKKKQTKTPASLESGYGDFKHKGKQVVDEKCSCKHLKSEHGARFAIGHGACSHPDCKCKQFTWVGWVTEK